MISTMARFESTVENRVGHFLLDHDCPVYIAKEMCFQFLTFLGKIEESVKQQAAQQQLPIPDINSEEPKQAE